MLSDRVGSHLRPLRWVSLRAVAVMLLMAVAASLGAVPAAVILIVAAIVTVADNGLAYTSVAEIAGPFWSGRALGAQNTGQFLAASVVGPAVGGADQLVGSRSRSRCRPLPGRRDAAGAARPGARGRAAVAS